MNLHCEKCTIWVCVSFWVLYLFFIEIGHMMDICPILKKNTFLKGLHIHLLTFWHIFISCDVLFSMTQSITVMAKCIANSSHGEILYNFSYYHCLSLSLCKSVWNGFLMVWKENTHSKMSRPLDCFILQQEKQFN